MKISFILFLTLFQGYFLVLPNWNFAKSVTDLLANGVNSYKYVIDERKGWYISNNKLEKEIKRESNGQITHKNTYDMRWSDSNSDIYTGDLEFESIESFYGYVDGEADHPIICPKGSYNPYEIPENHKMKVIADFSKT